MSAADHRHPLFTLHLAPAERALLDRLSAEREESRKAVLLAGLRELETGGGWWNSDTTPAAPGPYLVALLDPGGAASWSIGLWLPSGHWDGGLEPYAWRSVTAPMLSPGGDAGLVR